MIYNFFDKIKNTDLQVSEVSNIKTSVGTHIGFVFKRDNEEFKVFYYDCVANVVIEDNNGYIMEISINEL